MPLLRKQPFVREKIPPNLKPKDEVFHCKITNEIFTDYEKFFERIILCNSLVWTCAETGRPGLTFQEALDCEKKARKQIADFPEYLIKPVLFLASKTHRSRINDVVEDVYSFSKDRFFVNETVEVQHDGQKKSCKVMKVIAAANAAKPAEKEKKDEDVIVLDSDEEEDIPLSKLQKSPSKEPKESNFGQPAEKFQYVVQEVKKPNIYIVDAKQVCRKKSMYTRDKCKLFLKRHCEPDAANIWRVKKLSKKKYRIEDMIWREFFDGPQPIFGVSKSKKPKSSSDLTSEEAMIKQAKKARKEKKKIEKEMKKMDKEKKKEIKKAFKDAERQRLKEEKKRLKEIQEKQALERKEIMAKAKKQEREGVTLVKKATQKMQFQIVLKECKELETTETSEATLEEKLRKMTPEERNAYKEKLKQEKLAEKLAKKEEMRKQMEEKRQKLKEEREKIKEKKKEEERERKEHLKEYNKARDDLECDDLMPLPRPTPVQSRVPSEYFGDAVMVLEYLTCFNHLLELDEQFPHKISLDAIGQALQDTAVNGMFADLVSFLLTTIFQLQEEEEEYDEEEDVDEVEDTKGEQGDVTFRDLVKQATIAAQIPQQNFGTPLNKLHIDGFTLTEVLRLHFLASGAKGSERNNRFRYTQRGGYHSTDDAGLEFKKQEAAIIKSLGEANMFDLNPGDKLKILTALIHQLMTYVACRDVIEENFETMRAKRHELRTHQLDESRREKDEATFWYRKRVDERKKEQEEKAREKQEKKNKKLGENKEDVIDLCDSSQPSSQNNSRAPTPSCSPEDKKSGRSAKIASAAAKAMTEQRHSGRLKDKGAANEAPEVDWPTEHIEWDKVTPDDRIAMRNRFEKKEMELFEAISELQHSNAVHPLGKDRTFRRYWVFRSIPGIFVEDAEEDVPDDYYETLNEQTNTTQPPAFKSENLPLNNGDSRAGKTEKCASSDKENESFDQNKAAVEAMDTEESAEPSSTESETVKTDADQSTKTENESAKINLVNVFEQIRERNSIRWSYYNTVEDMDILINNLNPRGYREGPLKVSLQEQRKYLANKVTKCPVKMLSISEQESADTNVRFQKVKSRNRNVQGAVKNASASEYLELNLRELLLDLEERIFVGGLGTLKVNGRVQWREAIEQGNYDPQCENITWGASAQTTPVKARILKHKPEQMNGDIKSENGVDENETKSEVKPDVKPEVSDKAEDNDDLAILVVRDMSRALIQLSQMLEPKFLKPPLGDDEETRLRKQKEALELAFQGLTPRKIKAKVWEKKGLKKIKEEGGSDSEDDAQTENGGNEEELKKTGMERWQESLMACASLSQVFLHLSVLDQSIIWDKSALLARCKICRRKGDDEKMLLCDGCDSGYHMYCLKPPMKKIPKDDWYCMRCKPKDVVAAPKKRRKSTFDDVTDLEETTETEEEEEEESSEDESEDDEDTEEETEDETDEYDEDTEIEEEAQPTKIKFLKGFSKSKSSDTSSEKSGGSRGGSARSSRSNTPTPRPTPPKAGKSRTSLEKAMQMKAVAAKSSKGADKRKSSRHSIETDQPSARKSSRQLEIPRDTKSSRLSLDPSSSGTRGSKRRSEINDDSGSKHRRRGSDKVNSMRCCEDLLTELSKRDESWPFQAPVTKRDAPDYHDVIKHPMDFGTIRKKLFEVEYSSPEECIADLRLVFSNCSLYNMPQAAEHVAGEKLSRFMEKRIKELQLEPKASTSGRPSSPTKGASSPSGRKGRKN